MKASQALAISLNAILTHTTPLYAQIEQEASKGRLMLRTSELPPEQQDFWSTHTQLRAVAIRKLKSDGYGITLVSNRFMMNNKPYVIVDWGGDFPLIREIDQE